MRGDLPSSKTNGQIGRNFKDYLIRNHRDDLTALFLIVQTFLDVRVSGGGRGYHYGGTTGARPPPLDGVGWAPQDEPTGYGRNSHQVRACCLDRRTGRQGKE